MTFELKHSDGLLTINSCLGMPRSLESFLEGLSVRRFADNQEQTSFMVLSRMEILFRNSGWMIHPFQSVCQYGSETVTCYESVKFH